MMAATCVAGCAIVPLVTTLLERIDAALSYAMDRQGLAASSVAIKAGLSRGYFGKTRGDLRRDPTYDPGSSTLKSIAAACGVRADWLLTGDGTMLPERYPPAAPHLMLREQNTAWTLAEFLEGFAWPEDLLPGDASMVVRLIREEFLKATEPIPQSYWHMRIRRLIVEVQRASGSVESGLKDLADRSSPVRSAPTSGKKPPTKHGRE